MAGVENCDYEVKRNEGEKVIQILNENSINKKILDDIYSKYVSITSLKIVEAYSFYGDPPSYYRSYLKINEGRLRSYKFVHGEFIPDELAPDSEYYNPINLHFDKFDNIPPFPVIQSFIP